MLSFFATVAAVLTLTAIQCFPFVRRAGQPRDDMVDRVETGLSRGFFNATKVWPKGIVYYKFHSNYPEDRKEDVELAMEAIEKGTCIRFKERTANATNYIHITNNGSKGCSSFLGMRGGTQEVSLPPGNCSRHGLSGVAAHELLHSLGLTHEFQRPDRENYIRFHREAARNFGNNTDFIFGIEKNMDLKGIPFDFKSILQYPPKIAAYPKGAYIFTEVKPLKDGVPKPLGTYKNMGQTCRISAGDRTLIDRTYQAECGLSNVELYKRGIMIPGADCKGVHSPLDLGKT